MFTESNLRELLDFQASGAVLSVYLNTEPSKGNADAYKLRLRSLLKDCNLPQDQTAIEEFFNHQYDWSGRSVAVFSCVGSNFFRSYPLVLPVRDQVIVGEQPAVKPLANLFENFGGYGVILVDKQGARVFSFHMGDLIEQEGVMGEAVKHTKRGGASSFPGRRGGVAGSTAYEDELVDRNFKDIVQFATHFFEEKHIRRILLGGTDENCALLRAHLPKAWQSLIVGSFHMSMNASHAEVLEKSLAVGLQAERSREARMVDQVLTSSAKGGAAVTGLGATLEAVTRGRVLTLLVEDGYQAEGHRCTACGWLANVVDDSCPQCGGKTEKVDDLVELAVGAVLRQRGDVEVVAADAGLERAGSIGALLRY